MNDNAKKWVKALRSGDYKRGEGHLRNENDEFCCLGVACDLYVKENPNDLLIEYKDSCYSYAGCAYTIPSKVRKWLGLKFNDGMYYSIDVDTCSLASKNDVLHYTFEQIADIIESEPEGLFVKEEANA